MNDQVTSLIQLMSNRPSGSVIDNDLKTACEQFASATTDQKGELLDAIRNNKSSINDEVVNFVLSFLTRIEPINAEAIISSEKIVDFYFSIDEKHPALQQLLILLIRQGTDCDLKSFARLIAERPPSKCETALPAFALLMQRPTFQYNLLFPRILDGLQHPSAAAPILDLANFLVRQEIVDVHPAADRAANLTVILGQLAGNLGKYEDEIKGGSKPSRELALQVSESIALTISLCDALALMDAKEAIGKLYQVLELSHRRLRVEAAAALIRLEEPDPAIETVQELAADPTIRNRVVAYATELHILDKIDEKFRTPEALAEADLVALLTESSHFGFPPASCELIDARKQHWPGFDEVVDCFLFRFTYPMEHGDFQNIGIAGPLTRCVSVDLKPLDFDDIYALFAGWSAEHEDIFQIQIDEENDGQQTEIARHLRRLSDLGHENVTSLFLGSFFGERSLIASTTRGDETGHVVINNESDSWYPERRFPFRTFPENIYDLYKGQKLLRSFN